MILRFTYDCYVFNVAVHRLNVDIATIFSLSGSSVLHLNPKKIAALRWQGQGTGADRV